MTKKYISIRGAFVSKCKRYKESKFQNVVSNYKCIQALKYMYYVYFVSLCDQLMIAFNFDLTFISRFYF